MSNPLPPMPDQEALANARWFKAERSGNGGCVEVAHINNEWTGLRDTKRQGGPVHMFTTHEWGAFIDGAKNGDFDRN